MQKRMKRLAAVAALGLGCAAGGEVVHDESIDGDLSDDGFATTDLGVLGLGSSLVIGSVTATPEEDPDYFTFEIAAGQQLSMIVLAQYAPDVIGQQSFIAMQEGPQVTSDFDTSVFLGATLIGGEAGALEGDDILDNIGDPIYGGQGFTGPLGAGVYSVWFQENGGFVGYTFDFVVVPGPATVLGLMGLGLRRRRR